MTKKIALINADFYKCFKIKNAGGMSMKRMYEPLTIKDRSGMP